MIGRGCTCRNIFTIPYAQDEIEVMFITYQQRNKTVLEMTKDRCTFENGTVSVMLLQEETLEFDSSLPIKIQIRVKLTDGTVTKSRIIETHTDELLKNEVI